MHSLWPLYEKCTLMPHELAWCPDPDLARDAWWARMILKWIGRHDRSWVPVDRIVRDSELYVGQRLSADAIRMAAKLSGARVRPDAVGYDMIACDRLLWSTLELLE